MLFAGEREGETVAEHLVGGVGGLLSERENL